MVQHYDPIPEPIPEDWEPVIEAVLFRFDSNVGSQTLRDASDQTPAQFNTHSVWERYITGTIEHPFDPDETLEKQETFLTELDPPSSQGGP